MIRLAVALTVAMSASIPAQDVVPTETIVVTGKRPSGDIPTVVDKLAAIAPRLPADKPYPRFIAPLCFAVGGVSPELLRQVSDRLAANAIGAGARLAGDGCQPNVLLLFVADGKAEARKVYAERGWMFGGADPRRIDTFVKRDGPVRFLAVATDQSSEGRVADSSGLPPAGLTTGFDAPTLQTGYTGRANLPIQRALSAGTLVIDRAALIGKSAVQIADYATMRLLGETQYDVRVAPAETILSLFDAADTPGEMTALDRGYLGAIYDGPGNTRPRQKLTQAARLASGEVVRRQR